MTQKTPKERAMKTIISKLQKHEELHSCDLMRFLYESLGITEEGASNYIVIAYRAGLLRRGTRRIKSGFMYRLAEKFPDWGDCFRVDERDAMAAKSRHFSDIITSYKATSRVYQFDQLIRGCHGKCHTTSPR